MAREKAVVFGEGAHQKGTDVRDQSMVWRALGGL